MVILSGSSHPVLSRSLAGTLGVSLVDREISRFPDGGIRLRITGDVHGADVAIVQSLQNPIHDHLVEVLLLVDAVKESGAKTVIAVIPWLAYSKQDQAFLSGEPVSARAISRAISGCGADRVVLVDLHHDSIGKFFSIPVTHVSFMDEFVTVFRSGVMDQQTVVVSPDAGGLVRSAQVAKKLDIPMLEIKKERNRITGAVTVLSQTISVAGKRCLVVDDLIETGATVAKVGGFLKDNGAAEVIFAATHGLFSAGWEPILNSRVDRVYVSDSVSTPVGAPPLVTVLPLAPVLARELKMIRA